MASQKKNGLKRQRKTLKQVENTKKTPKKTTQEKGNPYRKEEDLVYSLPYWL